jgi:sialic acid synthase SpsE
MIKFIAEIGLNHLGDEKRAAAMIETLLLTPVDAITFQIREESFYNSNDPSRMRLSEKFYSQAVATVHQQNKLFGIATCDMNVVGFFDSLGVDFWKTLSWDLINDRLQNVVQSTGKIVYASTGVSGMDEIITASGKYKNVVFIHTQLSQNLSDVNLKAISAIRQKTGKQVAFGLHCSQSEVMKLAIGFEPDAMFFYVKDSNGGKLFDDEHAIQIEHVGTMLEELHTLSCALGSGEKISMEKPVWVVK